jgi:signal recognition particle subunit SRP54
VNKLLKQHKQMADMMKKMGKGGAMKNAIKQMIGAKGGMPDIANMSPEAMAEAAKGMKQGLGMGGGFPGMPRGLSLPSSLSGLMKKK